MLLLDRLIERSSRTQSPPGYQSVRASWTMTITREGELVGFEKSKTAQTYTLPRNGRPNTGTGVYTAIDDMIYTLGAVEDGRDGAHSTFRTSVYDKMLDRLVKAGSREAAAIRALFQKGRPPMPKGAKPKDMLIVRVKGSGDWWLDPTVQRVHTERLAEFDRDGKLPTTGQCSVCCRHNRELTRLFGAVRGGGKLISFNEEAWTAYGLDQGLNAPTCVPCAAAIIHGLADILADSGSSRTIRTDMSTRTVSWWSKSGDPLWSLFDTALAGAPDRNDRDAVEEFEIKALAAIHEIQVSGRSSLMVLDQPKGSARIALHRYVEVEGAELADRLLRWRRIVGTTPYLEKGGPPPVVWKTALWALSASEEQDRGTKDSPRHAAQQEQLYLALLGGEELPVGLLRRLCRNTDTGFRAGRQLALWCWATRRDHQGEDPMKMTPLEQLSYTLGRAWERANSNYMRRDPQPQRTLHQQYGRKVQHSPFAAVDLLGKHSTFYVVVDGRRVERNDTLINDLLGEATSLTTALGEMLPTRGSATAFTLGMFAQRKVDREALLDRVAKKRAAEAATQAAAPSK